MKKSILQLIKNRCSIRKYKNKPVSEKKIRTVLEAGIWGPSLAQNQCFRFIIIKNKEIKNKICNILEKYLKKLGIIGRIAFIPSTISAIQTAPCLIAIYNSGEFKTMIEKFARIRTKKKNNIYIKIAHYAELEAIAATIQNMILTAEYYGLGTCWLQIPVYCSKQINKIFNINLELIGFLSIGYPDEKSVRSPRNKKLLLNIYK